MSLPCAPASLRKQVEKPPYLRGRAEGSSHSFYKSTCKKTIRKEGEGHGREALGGYPCTWWNAEMGCSEVAMRYFSSDSSLAPPITCAGLACRTHRRRLLLTCLVELLVELLELSGLSHHRLLHEKRSLEKSVATLVQEIHAILDDGLVESHTVALQEVGAMARNSHTCRNRQVMRS